MTECRLNKRERIKFSRFQPILVVYERKSSKIALKTRFLGSLNVNMAKSGCLEAVRAIIKKFKGN